MAHLPPPKVRPPLLYSLSSFLDAETSAHLESNFRQLLTRQSPERVIDFYSRSRKFFLEALCAELPPTPYAPSPPLERKLWGISFRSPLMNAAGMFKEGFGYQLAARQGAGAFLAGTATVNPRLGFPLEDFEKVAVKQLDNQRIGVIAGRKILNPFTPLPRSGMAINKLGLPNPGDYFMQQRLQEIDKVPGCPVGISVALSPNFLKAHGEEAAQRALVGGMHGYLAAGVDFIELNESCPNTGEKLSSSGLLGRLEYLQKNFLEERSRYVPVVVKFSCDTSHNQLTSLMDTLFHLGYDGVNFGNTSTNYKDARRLVHEKEQKLFDHFTATYGGGVSGRALREKSLQLAAAAVHYLRQGPPMQEFHVIRTGGISSVEDVLASDMAGVSLNQWFTGYFERFAEQGHDVYRTLLRNYRVISQGHKEKNRGKIKIISREA